MRPFDSEASGTLFGDGVGAVVLKRLDDAIEDGDLNEDEAAPDEPELVGDPGDLHEVSDEDDH